MSAPCARLGVAVTLSAALRHDYWGWGYNNAPGTTNGAIDYNYPTYNGLPTTPAARQPEAAIDRMLPIRHGYTLNLRRWSPRTRARHPTQPPSFAQFRDPGG